MPTDNLNGSLPVPVGDSARSDCRPGPGERDSGFFTVTEAAQFEPQAEHRDGAGLVHRRAAGPEPGPGGPDSNSGLLGGPGRSVSGRGFSGPAAAGQCLVTVA